MRSRRIRVNRKTVRRSESEGEREHDDVVVVDVCPRQEECCCFVARPSRVDCAPIHFDSVRERAWW